MEEMGESLCASWLKHVKRCAVVQKNWKPSFQWRERDDEFVSQAMNLAYVFFHERHLDVLSLNQAGCVDYYKELFQTECDCLGCSLDGFDLSFYAVESAVHTGGLGYENSPSKVASKFFRIAMALYYFCGIKRAEISFVTPKVNLGDYHPLLSAISSVGECFAAINHDMQKDFQFTFQLYANEPVGANHGAGTRFDREVMIPICHMHPLVADLSEQFIRSVNLRDRSLDGLRVQGSCLRRALKDLGLKFEEFNQRCMTFGDILQMIEDLHDEGGSRVKAIRDYVSWRYRNELNGEYLTLPRIRALAAQEALAGQEAVDVQGEARHEVVAGNAHHGVAVNAPVRYDILYNQEMIPNGSNKSMRSVVLRIVEHRVSQIEHMTFEQLRAEFSKALNRYHEVVVLGAEPRYMGPVNLFDGNSVFVCGEWYGGGARENWHLFVDAVGGLGYDVVVH